MATESEARVTKTAALVLGYLIKTGTVLAAGSYTFQEAVLLAPTELISEMNTAASNNVGARLRCAFWLAVGSVVQRGRRTISPSSLLPPERLYGAAVANWIQAIVMAGQSATYYTGVGALSQWVTSTIGAQIRSSEASDIADVYRESISIANSNGAGQVSSQLSRLLAMPIPEDRSGLPAPPAPPNPGGWVIAALSLAAIAGGVWWVGPGAILAAITAMRARR